MNLISGLIGSLKLDQTFNCLFLYSGFNLIYLIEEFLIKIKRNEKSIIILLNFDETLIKVLSSRIYIQIIKKENQARFKCYLKGGIIALTNKTFLLDLLSKKLSINLIEYIVIGPHKQRNFYKELFILNLLYKDRITYPKFFYISNKPESYLCNYYTFKRFFCQIQNKFNHCYQIILIPRFHNFVDSSIRNQGKKIIEINIVNDDNLGLIKLGIVKLYNLCYVELLKKCNDELIKEIISISLQINNIFLEDFRLLASMLINNVNFSISVLINDLIIIRDFICKLDYLDYAQFYNSFLHCYLKMNKENGSIFSYLDLETTQLFEEILTNLKNSLYRISSVENNELYQKIYKIIDNINNGNIVDYQSDFYYQNVVKLIKSNEKLNLEIVQKKELIINEFTHEKLKKIVYLLNQIFIENENKSLEFSKFLILTKNSFNRENVKDYLISCFILKDSGKSYLERKLRNYYFNKHEFTKREKYLFDQKNINSERYAEYLLIHLYMMENTRKFELFNQEMLNKILDTNEELDIDQLPSEIQINENLYFQYDQNSYGPDKINPLFKIYVENFNNDNQLNDFIKEKNIINVIMYDCSFDTIRILEVNDLIKNIYCLNNTNSFEFWQNLKKLNNEKKIFSNLLKLVNNTDPSNNKIITNESKNKEMNILMDFREISSKLPYYIYKNDMNIISSNLEVGDYITCDIVCFERKSISTGDLFDSLKNGRLISQIIKMKQYLEHNFILLEFEENFNLNLQKKSFYYRKIIELKTMFNNVYFLWSLSPKMSAEIIKFIKIKFNIPLDIFKCQQLNKNISQPKKSKNTETNKESLVNSQMTISRFFNNKEQTKYSKIIVDERSLVSKGNHIENIENKYGEEISESDMNSKIKISIEKFLRKVDGICQNNIALVYKSFKNMKEFLSSNIEKLEKIFGKNQGKKIYYFLTRKFQNHVKIDLKSN